MPIRYSRRTWLNVFKRLTPGPALGDIDVICSGWRHIAAFKKSVAR